MTTRYKVKKRKNWTQQIYPGGQQSHHPLETKINKI